MLDPEGSPLPSDDGPVMFAGQDLVERSARQARRLSHGDTTRTHSPTCLLVLPPQGVYLEAHMLRGLPLQGASMDGWVFVGYIDEYGEKRETAYRCRRCAYSTR
jgi:hypothetical protein